MATCGSKFNLQTENSAAVGSEPEAGCPSPTSRLRSIREDQLGKGGWAGAGEKSCHIRSQAQATPGSWVSLLHCPCGQAHLPWVLSQLGGSTPRAGDALPTLKVGPAACPTEMPFPTDSHL